MKEHLGATSGRFDVGRMFGEISMICFASRWLPPMYAKGPVMKNRGNDWRAFPRSASTVVARVRSVH